MRFKDARPQENYAAKNVLQSQDFDSDTSNKTFNESHYYKNAHYNKKNINNATKSLVANSVDVSEKLQFDCFLKNNNKSIFISSKNNTALDFSARKDVKPSKKFLNDFKQSTPISIEKPKNLDIGLIGVQEPKTNKKVERLTEPKKFFFQNSNLFETNKPNSNLFENNKQNSIFKLYNKDNSVKTPKNIYTSPTNLIKNYENSRKKSNPKLLAKSFRYSKDTEIKSDIKNLSNIDLKLSIDYTSVFEKFPKTDNKPASSRLSKMQNILDLNSSSHIETPKKKFNFDLIKNKDILKYSLQKNMNIQDKLSSILKPQIKLVNNQKKFNSFITTKQDSKRTEDFS